MKRSVHHLVVTVGFLTRIPVRHEPDVHMGRVAALFPIVGALIGGIGATVLITAGQVLPMSVATALALVTGVLVTGAFHVDGLADSADALVGGTTPERRLEILKDSRHGTYGVAAIVCLVLVQFTLVSSQSVRAGAVVFFLAHILGRSSAVSVMKCRPPAHEGLGAVYVDAVTRVDQAAALVLAAGASASLLGPLGLVVLAGSVVMSGVLARRCAARIGGIVGDVLGAVEQVAETLVMIGAVIVIDRVYLWWM